ncbi:MAG: DNA primase, partial [Lachnospiraceae bacterium]|nr:DNA primase [Lachnospiraceae bacterium]
MYYPDEVIEEVRTRSPIVDVVGSYVHLTKKGGNYCGLCPFHNEKTPSFSVSASKQMFHCFGCGKGGNVVTFIMEYENATFPEAIELLADRAGITLPKREFDPSEKREADLRTRLLEIQKEAALFYCRVLRTNEGKTGLDYFRRRGISEEMIRSFGLGFSPMRPDALYKHLKQKGYGDEELEKSGLIRFNKNGGYDYFFNRVIFPIMDVQSRVIGFGGRVMGNAEPKYLNSPETRLFDKSRNLYGLHAAKRSREKYMIVSEGYIDIIALHQAGFTNSVASLGTAFTPQHAMILKRYVQEVVLCYDFDGAGKKAAMRAIPILREVGMRIRVMSLSPYKDPDEFLKNLTPEDFKARIDEAENAFLWEVSMIREQYDFSDPDDKTAFIRSAAKMLTDFTDEIERNSYTEAVAKRFGLDYGTLKTRVAELGNRKG